MTTDGINGIQSTNGVQKSSLNPVLKELAKNLGAIELPKSKQAITKADMETALNEPRTGKAMLDLLEKSPVGLGNQQSGAEIEKLGYAFVGTAYHIGAPAVYGSQNGGTIKVYSGKGTAEMGENERKTVYQNGNYIQESFYDEAGKLTKCNIRIKNDVTGSTEPNGMFTMFYNENGKRCFIR